MSFLGGKSLFVQVPGGPSSISDLLFVFFSSFLFLNFLIEDELYDIYSVLISLSFEN